MKKLHTVCYQPRPKYKVKSIHLVGGGYILVGCVMIGTDPKAKKYSKLSYFRFPRQAIPYP